MWRGEVCGGVKCVEGWSVWRVRCRGGVFVVLHDVGIKCEPSANIIRRQTDGIWNEIDKMWREKIDTHAERERERERERD